MRFFVLRTGTFYTKKIVIIQPHPTLPGREGLKLEVKVSPTGGDLEGAKKYCFL